MATSLKLALTFVTCMVVVIQIGSAAITCGTVVSNLSPCIPYLKGSGTVPSQCCNGVKSLNNLATTTADRQTACNCMKNAAGSIPGLKAANIASLPGKCGVSLPYKFSSSTNCATVK